MSKEKIKILYLGQKNYDGRTNTNHQSKACKELGAEFIHYNGDSEGELIEHIKDVDVVINQAHAFSEKFFIHMGNNGRCKALVSMGHGFEGLNIKEAVENGVILTNTASFGTEEVSNLAIMLFLVCARKLLIHNDLVKNGVWTRDYLSPMGHISGQTMGIIGIGDIGRAVGRKAQAFGLNVIAFDPYISSWDAKEYDIETVGSLNELAQKSDYISINCFHNDETHHMINSEFFSNMKETAYLINCARGKIVDEKALIDALNNKTIAGAGLDVFEQEPVDPNNPLLKMKNVAVTSHYASYSETAWERAGTQLGEEAMRIALGYWPMSLINPEVAQNIPPRKKALNWEMILKNHS